MRPQNRDTIASERFAQFAAEGSHSALAEALDLVAPELLRSARLLTSRAEDAAELVQDTFLAAIESRHRFEAGRAVVPWLIGILQNLHRHRSRARARQVDPEQLTTPTDAEPSVLVDRKFVREGIERGIEQLPPVYRDVVSLHLRDGLRPEEIGRLLDRPAGRIRTQLWRGLRQLREVLPAGFATSLVALLAVAPARAQAGTPTDAAGTDGSEGPLPHRLYASRWPRRSLAIVATLASVVLGTLWIGTQVGPRWDQQSATVGATARGNSRARTETPTTVDAAAQRVAVDLEPRDGRGTVRAHLIWADTSQPAARQSVRLQVQYRAGTSLLQNWFDNVREGTTDGDGTVLFERVPAGTARLLFDDALVQSAEFMVDAGGLVERTEQLAAAGEIAGVVVDGDGRPVAGASVWLSSTSGKASPGYSAMRTGADGTFVLRALIKRWAAWATAAGYARSAVYFDPDSLSISRPRLVLGPLPATIDGTIRSSDGIVLPGALVGAFPLAPTRTHTTAVPVAPSFGRADKLGHYSLSGLEPGPHLVVARAASACAELERVTIGPGATAHVDLRLGRGATVYGRAGPGPLVSGLRVTAQPRQSDAASGVLSMLEVASPLRADGTYRLEHVFPGAVSILAHPGSEPRCCANIDVVDGQVVEADLLPLRDQHLEIAGRVEDERGVPVAGIEVRSMPAEFNWLGMREDFGRSVTDADGRFSFAARPGRSCRCVAVQERGFAVAASGTVSGGCTDLRLTVAAARAEVRGFVCDTISSTPPADVDLCQLPQCQSTRLALGPGGRFEIGRLPPGDYALFAVVPHDTLRSRLATFHLGAGETRDLGSLPIAIGELMLRLRRADGRPVRLTSPLMVFTQRDNLSIAAIATAPEGLASQRLGPEAYQVRCEGADFLPVRRDVEIAAGKRTELVVELRPARTCSFTFTLPEQVRPTRLWLRIDGPDGRLLVDHALKVPEDFDYRIDVGLPPGANHVRAVTALGFAAESTVMVPDGDPTRGPALEVHLPLR